MKSDIEPGRIKNPPAKVKVLSDKRMVMSLDGQGIDIKRIELRQYIERRDSKLGDYSLLTVIVDTDKGTVEMKYDEGFRGPDALDSAVAMLVQYAGLSALINRALIALSE
jgi:hypothetical protein